MDLPPYCRKFFDLEIYNAKLKYTDNNFIKAICGSPTPPFNPILVGFFMDVKWGKNYLPLVISRTKQVRNMTFCMSLPCLKYFLKM